MLRIAGLALGVFVFVAANSAQAQENFCSPLYKLPLVKRVIKEHIDRATATRRRDPSIPYDVPRNVDLLSDRISKALREGYVDNSEYAGSLQEKRERATDAVLGFGLNALLTCFPDYTQLYVTYVDRDYTSRVQAQNSVAEPSARASSEPKCPPILSSTRGHRIIDEHVDDLVRRIENGHGFDVNNSENLKDLSRLLWRQLGHVLQSEGRSAEAELENFSSFLEVLERGKGRECLQGYDRRIEMAVKQRKEKEAEQSKNEEVAAAAEREAKVKAEELRVSSLAAYEKEMSNPARILSLAYHNYFTALTCHDARRDHIVKFIGEHELADSRRAMSKIEGLLKSKDPSLEPEKLWEETVQDFGGQKYFAYFNDNFVKANSGEKNITVSIMLRAMQYKHGELYRGETGVERLEHFKMLLRNPRSSANELRAVCLDANEYVRKTLAKLDPVSTMPKKDF